MSDSNDRFGRRSAQGDKTPAEPVLSFTPRSDNRRTRDDGDDHGAPRLGRGSKKSGPTVDTADRPSHLSEDANRGSGGAFGWLVLVVVIAVVGVGYAWHVYTPGASAPAVPGYTTPQQQQPASNTAATTPTSPPPAQALGAAGQVAPPPAAPLSEPATQTVGTTPTPKSLPPTPPEPPRKTISDAAAEHPLTTTTPPPAATPATTPSAKPAASHKDSSLDLPKPHAAATPAPPMPNLPPPTQAATPAPTQQAPTQQAIAVPQTFSGPAATGAPQPLSGAAAPAGQSAATTTAPPPSAQSFNLAPYLRPQTPAPATTPAAAPAATATPIPGTNSVTVNGITYVNGQQPQALGTITAPTPDASNAPTSLAPMPVQAQPANTARPYVPSDSSAPLPNDVIIGPNGQMSVPSGQ